MKGRHRHWNDAATSQGTPEPQEARSSKEGRFPRAFKRAHGPASTCTWDFQPPELQDSTFPLSKATRAVVLCTEAPENQYSIQRPATEPWGSAPTCSYHIIGQLRMGVNFVLEQIIIINARTLHPGAHRSPEPGRVASLGSIPACTSQVGGPSVTSTRFTFPPFSRPARSPPPGAAAPVQVGAELAILPAPWSGGATDFQLCDRTTRQVESGTIGPGAPKHILGN